MPDPTRPKVGPADPDTRRKLLQDALNQPTKSTGVVTPPPPKPKKKRTLLEEVSDAVDAETPRERRYGPNGKTEKEITGE